MGNIKPRPCCVDRTIAISMPASKLKLDIAVKTERLRLIGILVYGVF